MHIKRGFTLVELVVVVGIVALLATLAAVGYGRLQRKSRLARVSSELSSIADSVSQYAQDNGFAYPADTERSVPPGLEAYLQGGTWPKGAWERGVYDWDNWTDSNGQPVYQISYRLCGLADPVSYCSDSALFPNFTRNSAIYYCIQGACVPHRDHPTVPGYCVNCNPKEVNY